MNDDNEKVFKNAKHVVRNESDQHFLSCKIFGIENPLCGLLSVNSFNWVFGLIGTINGAQNS